jgi:cell division protein FtsB
MPNAVQNINQVRFWAIWLAALVRVKPFLLKPAVLRSMLGGAILFFGLTYVLQANGSAAVNVQIKQLRAEAADLSVSHEKLERQVVQLKSLSRIAEASNKLNLVAMPNQQFAHLDSNRVATAR